MSTKKGILFKKKSAKADEKRILKICLDELEKTLRGKNVRNTSLKNEDFIIPDQSRFVELASLKTICQK